MRRRFPPPNWASPNWLRGEPDLVIEMDQEFEVPAGGPDIYRYFVVPVEIPRDEYITGLEFRPGDPQAVHHSLVYIDYTGRARAKDETDPEYGFSVFGTGGFMDSSDPNRAIYLGGWSPGIDPLMLPPGHGIHCRAARATRYSRSTTAQRVSRRRIVLGSGSTSRRSRSRTSWPARLPGRSMSILLRKTAIIGARFTWMSLPISA